MRGSSGDLRRQDEAGSDFPLRGGGGVCAARAAPLETFFEVFLRRNIENVQEWFSTRRAALGAADLERPAGETPLPPRRDVPCAGCAWQEFIVCAARLSFGVVRELWGFPLGCRRLKCLLSTFLSTSLDDFEALGANFTLLERSWSLLGRIWGGTFGGSGAVLERSWRPSCGNAIFGRFLSRFWCGLGRPRRGGEGSPS